MTMMDRPFVFWCAHDAYVYAFEEYYLYVRMGEMTEEGITVVAIHDALVASCSYLPSMREDVRNDPYKYGATLMPRTYRTGRSLG